jgi:D-alanyl-D-alanine carboxypeptidase (penicillin-binding protein 5/6)
MIAQILALFMGSLLSIPAPQNLDGPGKLLTSVIPEGRVLSAQTELREGSPVRNSEVSEISVTADSYVIVDVGSGSVIGARNPSAVHPVASLTKLLTALTVMQKGTLEEEVLVGLNATKAGNSGSDMKLKVGEKIKLQDLLAGLLINSANDAAVALAEHVSGTEIKFSEEMNKVAENYALSRTHVVNSTGFDNREQFSSAYDMGILLLQAWRDPVLGVYLRSSALTVSSVDGIIKHKLKTTNRLLGERTDILAGKTGFTDGAGQSLAIVAENETGHPVIVVLLGSQDRFGEADKLLDWTFRTFSWPDTK